MLYLEDGWPTHLQGKTSSEEKPELITAHLKTTVYIIMYVEMHL